MEEDDITSCQLFGKPDVVGVEDLYGKRRSVTVIILKILLLKLGF